MGTPMGIPNGNTIYHTRMGIPKQGMGIPEKEVIVY